MNPVIQRRLTDLFNIACTNDAIGSKRTRIVSGIWYRNQLISIGFNSMKTDPFQATFASNYEAICIHAEMHALKKALKKLSVEELKKADIYVARAKKISDQDHTFVKGLAKPCIGCMKAIVLFEFRNVYYTED